MKAVIAGVHGRSRGQYSPTCPGPSPRTGRYTTPGRVLSLLMVSGAMPTPWPQATAASHSSALCATAPIRAYRPPRS